MRIAYLTLAFLGCSLCAEAEIDYPQLISLLQHHCPSDLYGACLETIIKKHPSEQPAQQRQALALWRYILERAASTLDEDTYHYLASCIYTRKLVREPRESDVPQLNEDDNQSENKTPANFALIGSIAINNGNAVGFNFATDRSRSRQSGTGASYNFATYGSSIITNGAHDINFATGKTRINSAGDNRNINMSTGGRIQDNEFSHTISLLAGDKTTKVATQGSKTLPATGYNVVIGANSTLNLDDTQKLQESINFVTSGATAQQPENGINLYPGSQMVRSFGDIDVRGNAVHNAERITNSGDMTVNYNTDDNDNSTFAIQENGASHLDISSTAITPHTTLDLDSNDIININNVSGAGTITFQNDIDMNTNSIQDTSKLSSSSGLLFNYDTSASNNATLTIAENGSPVIDIDSSGITSQAPLDMGDNGITNVNSLSTPNTSGISVESDLDMNGNEIRNTSISVQSITSDDTASVTYDFDDSNTASTPTDEGFEVREGSNRTSVFRIDKNEATLFDRPFNLNGNTLSHVSDISGNTNTDIHITAPAESGNTASIILEPGSGNGAGDLEVRNLPHGSGTPLVINNGIVHEESSSRRFKRDITPCDTSIDETILQLQPVHFVRSASDILREYGLIAEDTATKLPELVTYEADGTTPYGIKYHQLTVLLLHLLQRQQEKIQEQEHEILNLKQILGNT